MSKVFTEEKIKSYLVDLLGSYEEGLPNKEVLLDDIMNGMENLSTEIDDKYALYTSRDASAIRNNIITRIQSLTDDWSDFNESDAGAALIELIAGFSDYLGFYLDKQSLETFITSVKQRKNGAAILSLINYKMGMASSCVTTGKLTFPKTYDEEIEIPKYFQVSAVRDDGTKIFYATKENAILQSGINTLQVPLIQGKVVTSTLSVANLKSNRKVKINTNGDIAVNSLIIRVGEVEFYESPDVLMDDVEGPKYSFYEDKECNPTIIFHESYTKFLPSDDNAEVEFTFLVTLGPDGKIGSNVISRVESSFVVDGRDIKNEIQVTNLDNSSGGSYRETLDHARVQAPKTLSTLGKAIVLKDYENLTNGIPGVLKSKAVDWSVQGNYVSQPWVVQLYVVPTDGGECSVTQLNDVVNYFEDKKMSPITVRASNPQYVKSDISMIVHTSATPAKEMVIRKSIESKLREFMNPEDREFGDQLGVSNIITAIQTSSSLIKYVELLNPTANSGLRLNQFPILGDIDINIIYD